MKNKLKIKNILFNILIIITVLMVGFVAFNIAFGARGYAVTSNSMAQTLKRGDLVFVKKAEFDELQVGDIITVGSSDSKEFFTHRIVEINKKNRTVTTKGDNNPEIDPMDTSAERIVGKMWYSIPLLGYFAILFSGVSTATGLIVLASVAVVLVGLNIILTAIKKKNNGGGNDE